MGKRRRGRNGRHDHNRENIPESSCCTRSWEPWSPESPSPQESWHSQGASLGPSFRSCYFQTVFPNSTFPTNARSFPPTPSSLLGWSWDTLRSVFLDIQMGYSKPTLVNLTTKSGTDVYTPSPLKSGECMHFTTDSDIHCQNKKTSRSWMPHSSATDASLSPFHKISVTAN